MYDPLPLDFLGDESTEAPILGLPVHPEAHWDSCSGLLESLERNPKTSAPQLLLQLKADPGPSPGLLALEN